MHTLSEQLLKVAIEVGRRRVGSSHEPSALQGVAQSLRTIFGLPGPVLKEQSWYVPKFDLLCNLLRVWRGTDDIPIGAIAVRTDALGLAAHFEAFDPDTATDEQICALVMLLCRLHALLFREPGRACGNTVSPLDCSALSFVGAGIFLFA